MDASPDSSSSSMLLDPHPSPPPPPPPTTTNSPSSDHSSHIASKLLQGWTLLAHSCPLCLTPLVRNRQKQMFCVSCQQWVLSEEQLADKLQAQQVLDSPQAPPSNTEEPPRAVSQPPISAPNGTPVQTATLGGKPHGSHMRVASLRDDAQNLDERSPKRLASTEFFSVDAGGSLQRLGETTVIASPSGPSDHSTSILPKVISATNPAGVLSSTVSTLYQKLEEIRQATAACQDLHELNQLLSALGECMQAIQRAHSLATAHGFRL